MELKIDSGIDSWFPFIHHTFIKDNFGKSGGRSQHSGDR